MSDDTASMPLEELFERARKVLLELPFARLMGMKLVDMNLDEATIELGMRDDLRQPSGILHGGVTATLIDTAMAFAVRTRIDPDAATATIDLTVHYLRPHLEGPLRCTAKVVRAGRRIFSVSADVTAETNGKLIATGLSTYTIV
ncbi:MAG TPA: PaaI family thioesterase [Pyrinomonadaceae bacterium]|nr:PaaI family thioesterase [Pyrinomonadaceae bacterium]